MKIRLAFDFSRVRETCEVYIYVVMKRKHSSQFNEQTIVTVCVWKWNPTNDIYASFLAVLINYMEETRTLISCRLVAKYY